MHRLVLCGAGEAHNQQRHLAEGQGASRLHGGELVAGGEADVSQAEAAKAGSQADAGAQPVDIKIVQRQVRVLRHGGKGAKGAAKGLRELMSVTWRH